jgi:hypothetical protein
MEKRYQSIDGMISVTVLIVLSESQLTKLESKDYRERIDNIAEDLNLEWAVETNGNVSQAAISRLCGLVVGSNTSHEIEMDAIAFMNAVDKLTLPSISSEEKISDKEFVKKLLEDINTDKYDNRHVVGALVVDTTTDRFCPELTGWGQISHDLLKEFCELYLKTHE